MATIRTKTTELSVAFGLLGREPSSVRPDEIEFLFDETLGTAKPVPLLISVSTGG